MCVRVLLCIHGYESKPWCPSVHPKMTGIHGSSFSSFPPCRHIPTLDPKVFFCYTHTIYPVLGFLKWIKMVDPQVVMVV